MMMIETRLADGRTDEITSPFNPLQRLASTRRL